MTKFVQARDVNGTTVTIPETWALRFPDRFTTARKTKTSTPAVAKKGNRPADETPAGDVPEEE